MGMAGTAVSAEQRTRIGLHSARYVPTKGAAGA